MLAVSMPPLRPRATTHRLVSMTPRAIRYCVPLASRPARYATMFWLEKPAMAANHALNATLATTMA